MANRLITDIPSDIVSDGLQLWTDDIPMFGELLPSVKLLVRLPDSTKAKQYAIKYSMVSDEENHTIIFEGSISELKVSSKLEFDEMIIVNKLNETIGSLFDINIRDIDIFVDAMSSIKQDIVNELLFEKGIFCLDERICINRLGFIYNDNDECIGTTEAVDLNTTPYPDTKVHVLSSCVKIANTDFNKVYIPNVNDWDITISSLSFIEETTNSNEISSISLKGNISISAAKDLSFKYTNIDISNTEQLIQDRLQYISISNKDNDDDIEFDIDF